MSKVLIFTADGKAELIMDDETVWSSDADEDFADDGFDDFLTESEDLDGIIDFLMDKELIDDGEEIEIETEAADDSDDEDDQDA